MSRQRISAPTVLSLILLGACTVSTSAPPYPAGRLELTVSPLNLPNVSDACYTLTVTNEANATVWTEPGLCASQYGRDGGLTFVGSCDATDSNGGGATNTITLTIDDLYASPGIALNDYQDPCAAPHSPGGCKLTAPCVENADSPVTFNLTILREANQGFFDIAVSFDDIFCSAKVDCEQSAGVPLNLLHNPSTGQRGQTAVVALACTAGPNESGTVLLREPLTVTCGSTITNLDPTRIRGNVYGAGAGQMADPDANDAIWQYAIYAGEEMLNCGTSSCNKQYWNIAIGFSPTTSNCVLTTRASAIKGTSASNRATPANTLWPVIDYSVRLTANTTPGTLACSKHPLNASPTGVSTTYAPANAPVDFDYAFDGENFGSGSAAPQSLPQSTPTLLDAPLPSADSSWSLRKLRAAYTGPAINVRRASDGAQLDIGFDANGHLDTTALLGFVGTANATVATWYDQSGQGNHFVQTNPTLQPAIALTGVLTTTNGKPSVRFDGSNDFMFVPSSNAKFNFLHNGINSFIASVVKLNPNTTPYRFYTLLDNGGAGSKNVGIYWAFGNNAIINNRIALAMSRGVPGTGDDATFTAASGALYFTIANTQTLFSVHFDGDNPVASQRLKSYKNGGHEVGVNIRTNAPAQTNSTFDLHLGAYLYDGVRYDYFGGDVQEIAIYNSDQAAQMGAIHDNINAYYTIFDSGTRLLDSHSSPVGAYSTRKLKKGYLGHALRVRRTSDNAELDVGFDASGNLDQTNLLAFTGSQSAAVKVWYDQSGNGKHGTQTTNGFQPLLVSAGVVKVVNNRPSVNFDGSDDFLDLGYVNGGTKPTDYSTFAVARFNSTASSQCMLASMNAAGQGSLTWNDFTNRNTRPGQMEGAAGNGQDPNADANFRYFYTAETFSALTQYVFEQHYQSNTAPYFSKFYWNGAPKTSVQWFGNVTNSGGVENKTSMGRPGEWSGIYFGGDIQEVVIYNTHKLSTRSSIATDINNYFSTF